MEEDNENKVKGKQDEEKEDKLPDKKSSRYLFIALGLIILVFAGFFISRWYFSSRQEILTIDDMHRMNLEGKESDKNYMFNGFSFVYWDGMWYTQAQKGDILWNIPLHFGPRDIEDIPVYGKLDDRFNQRDVYMTFNPVDKGLSYVGVSITELGLSMVKSFGKMPIAACDRNETEACFTRPIVDCSDTDKSVIYIRQANESRILLKGNCAIIEGNDMELIKSTDKFILIWYAML